MAIDDNAAEQEFGQLARDVARRRTFGFTSGMGLQTTQGNYPSGPSPRQSQVNVQSTGVQPNYGFSQGNYNANPGAGTQIMGSLLGRMNRGGNTGGNSGGGRRGSTGSAAAPANSRTLKRGATDNSNNVFDASTGITVQFGNQSAGFSTGDIFGPGAQVDQSSNVDSSSRNVTMGGGQTGRATATASGTGAAPAAPKRAKTGGRQSGQLSQTPNAIAKREKTAARRTAAQTAGAPATARGSVTQKSEDTNVMENIDLSSGQRKGMFNSPPSGSGGGSMSVGSDNRIIQAQGENIDASQDANVTNLIKQPPKQPPKTPTAGGPNLPPPPPPMAGGGATPTSPTPPSAGGGAVPAGAPATSGATQQTPASPQRRSGKRGTPNATAAPAATPAPTGNQPAAPQAAVQTPAPKGKPKATNPADALKQRPEILVTPTAPKSEPMSNSAPADKNKPAETKPVAKKEEKAEPAKKAAGTKKAAERKAAASKEATPKAEDESKKKVTEQAPAEKKQTPNVRVTDKGIEQEVDGQWVPLKPPMKK